MTNIFKMGLTEETNYSQDTMTSILYVNHAGPKDVGKYRLPDIFYYGNRYTGTPNISQRASMEAINAQNMTSMRPDPLLNPDDIR